MKSNTHYLKGNVALASRNIKTVKPCGSDYQKSPVLIAVNHRNQHQDLSSALTSIEAQTLFQETKIQVVVLDDHSNPEAVEQLKIIANKPYITILQANCGSASQARNAVLDWADEQPFVKWIARLDADDVLATKFSVQELVNIGEQKGARVALGGNQLSVQGKLLASDNHPSQEWLDEQDKLVEFIHCFCHGKGKQELPSCNLLLANRAGFRYPNIKSAEDHWLVAKLLLLHSNQVAIDTKGLYCKYSLSGTTTKENKDNREWLDSRHKLAFVVKSIAKVKKQKLELLGFGMEGIVYVKDNLTTKVFHPWGMSDSEAGRLNELLNNDNLPMPTGRLNKFGGTWYLYSPKINYRPVSRTIPYQKIKTFLLACYRGGIAPSNIKRENLMYHPNGELHYIDIGKDLISLSAGYFIDISARLYAIGVLGFSDFEMARRSSKYKQDHNLNQLDGFSDFYRELISELHPLHNEPLLNLNSSETEKGVSLLIKACAQDVNDFYEQVCHIVTQLECPRHFAEKVIVIDRFDGPFLRQFSPPNLKSVIEQAELLRNKGIVDRIIFAPENESSVISTYKKWFGRNDVVQTHTNKNAPLYHQLWAFDQIKTPYVLQCDSDVLIGRKDWQHDFLQDMLSELQKTEVHSVGFNIPKATDNFLPYFGKPGQFAPEVRFGLLDLQKFNSALPIENPVVDGKFDLTWHRAFQYFEKQSGYFRSVRGGSPASYYVHPNNIDKQALTNGVIRDLIAQDKIPKQQEEAFDLVLDASWGYDSRSEDVIFLLKGRHTEHRKLARCVNSLSQQSDQSFGVIVIDDYSGLAHSGCYTRILASINNKVTMIRHSTHHGRIPNFIQAINQICSNPDSLIVILDQDDFLMDKDVVIKLKSALVSGHDVVQMPMFRPNKPLKLYQPHYEQSRSKEGANVWAHLRAFKKSRFTQIPLSEFKIKNGEWFDTVTDYVTMLPLVELADKAIFIDEGYAYWHERDEYTKEHKAHQKELLNELFGRACLTQ